MGGPSGPLPVNLKQLEYFVAVAELGSFSKAAVILNIAQPALSRQVRLLETDLHVTLLMRNGRGVVLTEAGKRLFDHSVGILQLVSRTREDIEASRDEPAGRIVIGLPPSNTLPTRWLDRDVTAEIVGAPALVLGPEPIIGAQRVTLSLDAQRITLATDGLGPFAVAADTPAQASQ
mgnify:CR=1 FL=1